MNDYQVPIGTKVITKNGKTIADHPPAIVAMVVYHGDSPWTASTRYCESLDVPANNNANCLAGLVPDFSYRLDDLNVSTSEALRARKMTAYARMTLWFLKWDALEERLERT